jgi:hypothetical protein
MPSAYFNKLCDKSCRNFKVLSSISSFDRRRLTKLREKFKIGKLFAKHIKMKDQLAFLSTQSVPIAIGTPGRVKAIMDTDCSHLDQIRFIIIDVARDAKLRSIFDIPETSKPLLDIVFRVMLDALSVGRAKLVFAQ